MEALDPILDRAGAYGVRWGFVNLSPYENVLTSHGWRQIRTLDNKVEVWENPAAIPPPLSQSHASEASPASISWGILPLLSLFICVVLFYKILRTIDVE
jgi:hypothetical protein